MKAFRLILLIGFSGALVSLGCESSRPRIVASPRAHDSSFQSSSLQRMMNYRVLLPANYDQNTLRYPVLYLLHGGGGDSSDWTTETHIAEDTDRLSLIIVMPDGGPWSWYANSPMQPQNRFEDYIVYDLIPEIDRKYRTINAREGRAIGGASMGGYGAVKFGLKYPNLFVFTASFDGSLDAADPEFAVGSDLTHDLLEAFGPAGSESRSSNDLFILVEKQPAQELPYFFMACGTQDPLLESTQKFIKLLQRRKIAHNYMESSGGHNWNTSDHQLPMMLGELAHHVELTPKPDVIPVPGLRKQQPPSSTRKSATSKLRLSIEDDGSPSIEAVC